MTAPSTRPTPRRAAGCWAGYGLWSAGARIVVCDGGEPGKPRVRQGAGLAEGSRGLQVVDSVAARWGSFRMPGAQAVWSDFGQPPRAQASDVGPGWPASWPPVLYRARPATRP